MLMSEFKQVAILSPDTYKVSLICPASRHWVLIVHIFFISTYYILAEGWHKIILLPLVARRENGFLVDGLRWLRCFSAHGYSIHRHQYLLL